MSLMSLPPSDEEKEHLIYLKHLLQAESRRLQEDSIRLYKELKFNQERQKDVQRKMAELALRSSAKMKESENSLLHKQSLTKSKSLQNGHKATEKQNGDGKKTSLISRNTRD